MERQMTSKIYAFLDLALVGIFGMTMVDMMVIITGDEYSLLTIDNIIKTLFSLAGLFYLVFVKIVGGMKDARLDRKIKREELEKREMENDDYKENHK